MSEGKKPPPFPRPASSPGRDERRPITPPAGVASQIAAPDVTIDDATGKAQRGELAAADLEQARAKRPTDERIGRLEVKHDALALGVARIEGELKGQNIVLADIRAAVSQNQIEHTTLTMARIDVSKENAKAQINDDADARKIARLDKLDAAKAKRQFALKVAGLLLSGGVLAELLRLIFG